MVSDYGGRTLTPDRAEDARLQAWARSLTPQNVWGWGCGRETDLGDHPYCEDGSYYPNGDPLDYDSFLELFGI